MRGPPEQLVELVGWRREAVRGLLASRYAEDAVELLELMASEAVRCSRLTVNCFVSGRKSRTRNHKMMFLRPIQPTRLPDEDGPCPEPRKGAERRERDDEQREGQRDDEAA